MTFEVRLDRHADRALDGFPDTVAKRLLAKLTVLKADPIRPRPGADIKKLHDAPGVYRLRLGEYRIFYTVFPGHGVVVVTDVRHRSHAYD